MKIETTPLMASRVKMLLNNHSVSKVAMITNLSVGRIEAIKSGNYTLKSKEVPAISKIYFRHEDYLGGLI